MNCIDRQHIATTLLRSPAWARLALTSRDERLRERAADAIAARVSACLSDPEPTDDPRQLSLPIA